ncbi:Rhodanese-related sulfurtransferase [Hymenobacter arizonensis]|uniref:Rhodanese-related sulfurtransferase n=1 Tax=Hymenobacter arizonensis TaxID=1227077 RepID=A0A1I5TN89_HYMAR|nr:Rhodanese-related sulfurtransferase [Hymenobacter arizonensis]
MRITILLFLFLLRAAAPLAVQGQCLSLSELLAIGAEATALSAPQVVTQHLSSGWTFNAPAAGSREAFWTPAVAAGGALALSRLTVRPQRPGQDVVLKTTQASCVRQLRSELKSQKLEAQPVTCAGCEAVRFKGPDYEATIYSQMKGDYPFVVVVHQSATIVQDPAAKGSGIKSGAKVSSPLPAVDIATATQLLADPQALVLDVRTPEEFAAGHLERAQNLDFRSPNFHQQLSLLDPDARYVLYCASGNRSGQAAQLMQAQGIGTVTNVGGYSQLKAAGVN